MLKRWTWLALLLVATMALWGCSDDDATAPEVPSATPFETMAAAGAAYLNDDADCPGVMSASSLNDNLGDYTVIDIRGEGDFAAGHIPGAYNTTLGLLITHLTDGTIPTTKPYVVVCKSGQTAGHAKIAMELLGYEDVKSLKFGMADWTSDLSGPWDGNCKDELASPEQQDRNPQLTDHAFPNISGDVTARVAAMLNDGFKAVTYDSIKDNLGDYFILNYFGRDDYMGNGTDGVPGHIPGAFQFTPYQSLGIDQMLKNLPKDKPIVVYCWTGQHSSQVTAYLNMLGYDAYSLLFGSNNLFHTALSAHKWNGPSANDFNLQIGYQPTQAFMAMAAAGAEYINDNLDCPGVMSATLLNDNLGDYTVIDIRGTSDYDNGHIPGAINTSLGSLVGDLTNGTIPSGKPYVVVCKSGQTAGHAKIAMELLGYEDVYSLKWGMSDWHMDFSGPWNGNTGDDLSTPETANNNGALTIEEFPALAGDPSTIVATRVDAMLGAGFKALFYDSIKDNLGDYFILNYFGQDDYEGNGSAGVPGHIPGAFQFTPYQSLGLDEMLANLPTDKPIVVYCWTGQHSSQVTAYLNMLGYDAHSLLFGSNNLFHTDLTGHKWNGTSNTFNYDTNTLLVTH